MLHETIEFVLCNMRDNSFYFCSIIFCEAVAIYGVIMAIIMETKIAGPKPTAGETTVDMSKFIWTGYAVLGSGLGVGLSNLACGYMHPSFA